MPDRMLCKLMPAVVVGFLLVSSGYSQSNPPSSTTPPSTTPPSTPSPSTTSPSTERSQRPADTKGAGAMNSGPMMQVIEMNVAEVEAGRMAAGKATNPRVKEFADMMVKDHTEALNKLRGGTQASASTPASDVKPNAKHQETAQRLSKVSGAEFDREYMKAMVADHQEALRFLEQQGRGGAGSTPTGAAGGTAPGSTKAGTTDRPDTGTAPSGSMAGQAGGNIGSISQQLLPTVRHHLEMAQQIEKELQGGSGSPDKKNPTDTKAPRKP